jgi:cytoskeletal protein RodZ
MIKDDLKAIGEEFKQKRKERNLSLKEVENATSIRSSYLQAIEEGEVNKLISPIYAQGFIKQYATFLETDGDRIIREHPDLFTRLTNPEFSYGIGTLEVRGNPGSNIKWLPNVLWFTALILLFVLAWMSAKYFELI